MIDSALLSGQRRKRCYWFGKVVKELVLEFEVLGDANDKEEKRRIQSEAQDKGGREILGEAQGRHVCLQDLWGNLPKNGKERYDKDLFRGMLINQQKDERQKQGQGKISRVPQGVPHCEQREKTGVPKERKAERNWEKEDGYTRCETPQENCEDTTIPSSESCFWERKAVSRGEYTKYLGGRGKVQLLWDGGRAMRRPHDTIIERWNEYFRQSSNSLQTMQFIEKQQDNGRVFSLYEYKVSIPNVEQPQDKGILLQDILTSGLPYQDKSHCLTASYSGAVFWNSIIRKQRTMVAEPVRLGHYGGGGQGQRIYSVEGKSINLTSNSGGKGGGTGLYKIDLPDGEYQVRKLTPLEAERLQTLPDNFTKYGIYDGAEKEVADTNRLRAIGNGWTVEVISHILKHMS